MSLQLQLIDCNCNDCKHLLRDLEKFNKWKEWKRAMLLKEFRQSKAKEIWDARKVIDPKGRAGMLRVALKMRFEFDTSALINYGECQKLKKPIAFLQGVCQIETQECFEHRRV